MEDRATEGRGTDVPEEQPEEDATDLSGAEYLWHDRKRPSATTGCRIAHSTRRARSNCAPCGRANAAANRTRDNGSGAGQEADARPCTTITSIS